MNVNMNRSCLNEIIITCASCFQTTILPCHALLTCWGGPGSWKKFPDFLIWQKNTLPGRNLTLGSTTAKDFIFGKFGRLPSRNVMRILLMSHDETCPRYSGSQDNPTMPCNTSTKRGKTTIGVKMLFTTWLRSTWTLTMTPWEEKSLRV